MISCTDLMNMLDEMFINTNPSNDLRRKWSDHRLGGGQYDSKNKQIVSYRQDLNELKRNLEFINNILNINITINLRKREKSGPKLIDRIKNDQEYAKRCKRISMFIDHGYDWYNVDYDLKMSGIMLLDIVPNHIKWKVQVYPGKFDPFKEE